MNEISSCFQVVTVKVLNKTHDGLSVAILPDEIPAIIPIKHLSDCLHLCPILHECYRPGSELEAVLFCKRRVNVSFHFIINFFSIYLLFCLRLLLL